jgi:hypothetical protein
MIDRPDSEIFCRRHHLPPGGRTWANLGEPEKQLFVMLMHLSQEKTQSQASISPIRGGGGGLQLGWQFYVFNK